MIPLPILVFWASTSHSYGVLTLFPFCDLITGDGAADEVATEREVMAAEAASKVMAAEAASAIEVCKLAPAPRTCPCPKCTR